MNVLFWGRCDFPISKGYVKERLRSSLRKFYSRYWDLPYGVSIEHLQRERRANRGRLLLRTPGPVPLLDLQVFKCWDQSLLNLSFFRTFGKVGPVNQVNHTSWVAVVTPTDRPKSVRNRCLFELFVALFVLSLCPFDISVGVGAFVIGLSQISSFLSFWASNITRYFCFALSEIKCIQKVAERLNFGLFIQRSICAFFSFTFCSSFEYELRNINIANSQTYCTSKNV